ncbi:MAG: LysR family transcriptional regulator [Magnetospirillum gryphiswaldense]|nr:LysR family transcriptional regulator [Magnetospirillum gryphiswaldense]
MRWAIDDIPLFAAVVDHGGMSAAAEALGMPKSTLSTAVARLEKGLGLRLFDRNLRQLRLTEEGTTFYRHAQMILEQVREADATVAGLRAEPAGRLVVALPPAFCQEIVAPRLGWFHAAYPKIKLDMVINAHGVDLLRDQADLAGVVGPLADSEMVVRSLIAGPLIWVASPDYLARAHLGDSLDDLVGHLQVCEQRYVLPAVPVHVNGQAARIDLSAGLSHVGNPLVVRAAVMNGAGIAPLPRHYCQDQIADGSLVQVYGHVTFDVAASTISLVYQGRRLMSPRLRAFIDFLVDICRRRNGG